ncbi:hypothetical protein [Pseudarthrobacter sp. SSS035]|uniref:hypothetical protein n=1 Tax=Pseudarthrobacter sp. SSS035 TaxID=2931399 RepID=UPI00200FDB31|nr:hypothetical protein [Pseudarthrobacter sp. SSS035]
MNPAPFFGIFSTIYAVIMIVVAGLAIYTLVLTIVFLRLRIAELKRGARPNGPLG